MLQRRTEKKNRDHPRAITQGIEIWLLGQCDTTLGWEVDSCMYNLESLFNTWTEWNVAIHLTLYKTMSYVVLELFLQQMKLFL